VNSIEEYAAEFRRLSGLLDGALGFLKDQIRENAQAEEDYRRAKSQAWVKCPVDQPGDVKEWTAARREAWVDAETASERHKRDVADGMVRASYQAVKSRQAQISALQSLLGAHREEAQFARTVPQGA
jgi:hypothetical protein